MSFGMIFSIILIIVFVAFAFFGIKKFIDFKNNTQITKFKADLDAATERIWKNSLDANEPHEYFLPSKVKYVCFMSNANREGVGTSGIQKSDFTRYYDGEENMFLYPPEKMGSFASTKIEHINVTAMVEDKDENPYCFENKDGKVGFYLQKNYGENLVRVVGD